MCCFCAFVRPIYVILLKSDLINEVPLSNLFIAAIQCLKRKRLYEQQIEQLGNFQLRIHDQVLFMYQWCCLPIGNSDVASFKLCLYLFVDDNARGSKSYHGNCGCSENRSSCNEGYAKGNVSYVDSYHIFLLWSICWINYELANVEFSALKKIVLPHSSQTKAFTMLNSWERSANEKRKDIYSFLEMYRDLEGVWLSW